MPTDVPSVLILHNALRTEGQFCESDAGVLVEARATADALDRLGWRHRTVAASRLADVPGVLASAAETVVFNLVEGFCADLPERAALVPGICEAFGKGCTGGATECLMLTLDKWRTKAVLHQAGVPAPGGLLVEPGQSVRKALLPAGPWIVKPAFSDASEGIQAGASIFDAFGPKLLRRVRQLHQTVGQAVLVEQLVGRRELNISAIERDGEVVVLPLAEIDFSAFAPGKPRIVDYAAKWVADSFEYKNTPRIIPAPVSSKLAREIRRLTKLAWQAVGCRDYARVEFRLDARCRLFVLEVNQNPDISPDAGLAAALDAGKVPFEHFVRDMVRNAQRRMHNAKQSPMLTHGACEQLPVHTDGVSAVPAAAHVAGKAAAAGETIIRRTRQSDRDEILRFTAATGFFQPYEVDIAREVLDDALAQGPAGHYQSFSAVQAGRCVGWVCVGPTPCTDGTFDIYWIVVSPDAQRGGIGSALMNRVEQTIVERAGRLAIIETAGKPIYEPTRHFYLKLGYYEAARVADFYAPGDDKIVYVKRV